MPVGVFGDIGKWFCPFLLIKLFQKHLQQCIVVGWIHETEADVFIIQEWEGRAVTDHQTFPDRCFKEIHGCNIVPQDTHQNEVAMRRVIFYRWAVIQDPADALTFGSDQILCVFDIFLILEHDLTGNSSEGIDRPRVLFTVDLLQKLMVAADGVTKAESGSSKEL